MVTVSEPALSRRDCASAPPIRADVQARRDGVGL